MALDKKDYEKALSREYGFPVFLSDKEYERLSQSKPKPSGGEKTYQDPFGHLDKKPSDKPENPWASFAPGGAVKGTMYSGKPAEPSPTPMGGPSINPWYQAKPGVSAPMDPSLPDAKYGVPTYGPPADMTPLAALQPMVAPLAPKKPPKMSDADLYADAWGK